MTKLLSKQLTPNDLLIVFLGATVIPFVTTLWFNYRINNLNEEVEALKHLVIKTQIQMLRQSNGKTSEDG